MRNEALQYLKELLERKYGDLNDDGGCYAFNDETGESEWLSVKAFADLIDRADEEYDD